MLLIFSHRLTKEFFNIVSLGFLSFFLVRVLRLFFPKFDLNMVGWKEKDC